MIGGISSLSTASISETRQQMFSAIDTNGDGSIDKTEMNTFIQENATSLVDTILSNQDTDQDSLISLIESNSGMEKLGQEMRGGGAGMPPGGAVQTAPEEVFDTADTNEDGVVSKDELAVVMGQDAEDIDNIFNQVDTDGDGSISKSEDEAWLEKMDGEMKKSSSLAGAGGVVNADGGIFAKADADGDGSVSEDELSAVIGKDVSSLFSKIDTNGDGLISKSEDSAWLEQAGGQVQELEASTSETGTINSSQEDWRSIMFSNLLKSFVTAAKASTQATSIYA